MDTEAQGIDSEQRPRVSDRIVEAARQLFFLNGYSKTQLRAIADLAGTSESGILRVFPSKAIILLAVYDWCWQRLNAHVETELAEAAKVDRDPRHLLMVLIRSLLEFYDLDHPMMAFIASSYNSSEETATPLVPFVPSSKLWVSTNAFYEHIALVEDLCTKTVSEGLAPKGITPIALREFVLSIPHGVHQGWLMIERDGRDNTRATVEEVMTLVESYLYATPA